MKSPLRIGICVGFLGLLETACRQHTPAVRDGDLIFQTSRSSQSLAIQRATGSPYSHMGLIFIRDGQPYVFEAIATVRLTPLDRWIARGEGHHFVLKRLRNAETVLDPEFDISRGGGVVAPEAPQEGSQGPAPKRK